MGSLVKAAAVGASRTRPGIAPAMPFGLIPPNLDAWPPVWWVGCHGGAGVSTLARLVGFGLDFGQGWPMLTPATPEARVVLVCRASAAGTWAATGAIEQWRRRAGMSGSMTLLGVVAVAASPRRPPRIATERLQLLRGWTPQIWRVGWVDALLAADDPRDVGAPPDVEALRTAIWQKIAPREGTR
ncbi:hypothetical protein [Micromonospora parastrephiae]|uniref:hypothetical protein n=1 Tax=Micromonospora parastrephiae TaxID=2806101 RepID=UPI002815932E|nr:hypothetical protein [Micromonospora parastrephiae]